MTKVLNPKFIHDYPIFYNFMQAYENEEYQTVSLAKEFRHFLSLLLIKWKEEQQTLKCQVFHPSLSHSRHNRCATLKCQHVLG